MSHIVKYKLYPGDKDVWMPVCYTNAYHAVRDTVKSRKEVPAAWKKMTGTELRLSTVWFIVEFPSEADEVFFRLKWS